MQDPSPWWPVAVLLAGAGATYVWRGLGVALSGRLSPEDKLFDWVACVAYALLAGLIARMILLPSGPLAVLPLSDRAGAAILALVMFFLLKRNLPLGIASGVAALMILAWARGGGV